MLIHIIAGGETKYFADGTPYNEGGSPAIMDSDELTEKKYTTERDTDVAHVTEYWEGEVLRHRSVHVILKPLKAEAIGGEIG